MDKIKFDPNDPAFFEILRSVVFDRLRKGGWEQLYMHDTGFNEYFDFGQNVRGAEAATMPMVQEIFWQLIAQGVITPGLNISNPNLPWFRLTNYGKKVIQEERFLPHDPTNYIQSFKQIISKPDPIVIAYLEESLRCFTAGCLMASTMMLGIASEITFLNLCAAMLNGLKDASERAKFQKIIDSISMVAKFKFVRDKIEEVMKNAKQALPDNTIIVLLSVFDLVRTERNDVGHPQGDLPNLTRDQVFVYMRMFPQYCLTVQEVESYLKANKV